nr:leukocyte-associated Ig-like receptor-2 isoform c [Homo sapiens]
MSPHLTALLGLVLCLAQTIHTQEGALPRPSISAEPGTVISPGSHVTFMCRGPVGVQTFRLEREDRAKYKDSYNVFRLGPSESEARFHIDSESSGGPDSPDTEPGSSAGTVPGTEASGFDAP